MDRSHSLEGGGFGAVATAPRWPASLGARTDHAGTRFSVYAGAGHTCAVRVYASDDWENVERTSTDYPLHPRADDRGEDGVYVAHLSHVGPRRLYNFVIDGRELPDPYARFLPHGVHGPAATVDSSYSWLHGAGVSRPLREHIVYELHVGTFTDQGTFASARTRLSELADIGVTCIELMPIAAFDGKRGWGYDGVALFAPFAGYGTPDELRSLIDDAHGLGMSVILDVVYNHFGPAGNYLAAYSPDYFTSAVQNAWGDAPDFSRSPMRRLVLSNAAYWLQEFRFDGFRVDASHSIVDPSARHILAELADLAHSFEPRKLLVLEDERNEARLVTEMGADGIWADDFHHATHVTLTSERDGYYAAYTPGSESLADSVSGGWLFRGQTYAATGKPRGTDARQLAAEAFVYCLQNHDQIGNRAFGERLNHIVSTDAYCASSALLLFLPMTPLLFMGQEWAASSPFQYFTDHEAELGRLISKGRQDEFKHFDVFRDPARRATIPDPQSPETFERSRLRWEERRRAPHRRVLDLYRRAIAFRRQDPVMMQTDRRHLSVHTCAEVLAVRRSGTPGDRLLLVNFGANSVPFAALPRAESGASILLTSSEHPIHSDLPAMTAAILGDGSRCETT